MNLRILSNTKLVSLLVVSLTSIPNILASNSNNIVNNSFNCNGLSINRSAITKKISNTNNGYIFTQFGHNLSINPSGDSVKDKLLKTRGSLYADLAYRKLINRTCYIDAGIGVNGGTLAKGNNEFNGKINIFGGIKHESGVEATVQLSAPFIGNINKGGILNIKYDNKNDYMYKWAKFSIEGGYSDLYNKGGEGASPFIALRYDTRGIISYLGKIGKQINNYINIQILILPKEIFKTNIWPEVTLGKIKKESSIREGYYGVDEIYKNNTLEYGWTNEGLLINIEERTIAEAEGAVGDTHNQPKAETKLSSSTIDTIEEGAVGDTHNQPKAEQNLEKKSEYLKSAQTGLLNLGPFPIAETEIGLEGKTCTIYRLTHDSDHDSEQINQQTYEPSIASTRILNPNMNHLATRQYEFSTETAYNPVKVGKLNLEAVNRHNSKNGQQYIIIISKKLQQLSSQLASQLKKLSNGHVPYGVKCSINKISKKLCNINGNLNSNSINDIFKQIKQIIRYGNEFCKQLKELQEQIINNFSITSINQLNINFAQVSNGLGETVVYLVDLISEPSFNEKEYISKLEQLRLKLENHKSWFDNLNDQSQSFPDIDEQIPLDCSVDSSLRSLESSMYSSDYSA